MLDPTDVRQLLEGLVGALLGPTGSAEIRQMLDWGDVWIGGVVTAVLFTIGTCALGLYLSRSDRGSSFGAAGSLALLLVWIYYAAGSFSPPARASARERTRRR